MITEREWIRQASRGRRRDSGCWGAQYVLAPKKKGLKQDRAFRLFLLLLSGVIAYALPVLVPAGHPEQFADIQPLNATLSVIPREVSAVSYRLPDGLSMEKHTFTREQLLKGKMLLIDENHPLPQDVPAPNTFSIAVYGKGKVPVNDLGLRSGAGTIEALSEWFSALRRQNADGLIVCDATRSPAEQQQRMEKHVRTLMHTMPPQAAAEETLRTMDKPGTGELAQEYTVEIRPLSVQNQTSWQTLLYTSWRYGWIRTGAQRNERSEYRFRWVGQAHATAMTYLDLTLEEYLLWLHEKRIIAIKENGRLCYLILCEPVNGPYTSFWLPAGAEAEVSLDNMGYAVAACTFP